MARRKALGTESRTASRRDRVSRPSVGPMKIGGFAGAGFAQGLTDSLDKTVGVVEKKLQEIADMMIPHSPIKSGPLKGWTNDFFMGTGDPISIGDDGLGEEIFPHRDIGPGWWTQPGAFDKPGTTVNMQTTIQLTGPIEVRRRKDIDDLARAIDERLDANAEKIAARTSKIIAKRSRNQQRYGAVV